jgi:selenocysteine lyase/cysteine desulfurase
MSIPVQRHLFELPREIAYLNAAYMTPLPHAAIEAGLAGVRRKATPWKLQPAHFFEESERARGLLARLVGTNAEAVAIVPSASYGLAVAAANLPLGAGRRVLMLRDQFPSHVYCWRRVAAEQGGAIVTIEAGEEDDVTAAVLDAIDGRCAVAALPHCRWTDGRSLDLVRIAARCREVGAALVLDLTQSLGAMPFDVAEVQPDFMIAAGYKWLLGPYSLGWLYVAERHRQGRPIEENWIGRAGSEDFTRLVDYREGYQPGARRFDVGERSNFALMPAAIASLELLLEWRVDAIAHTLGELNRRIAARAASLGLETVSEERRAAHFLGLRFRDGAPPALTDALAKAGVHVSVRGDRLRVTPHLYNDDADIDRLFEALGALL